ncbi:hypothetical protein OIA45_48905 (plasmid) [Streptomyces chartreusis]|uniref:hypothetical protein n=1 Tax=Streptomyces chartreusis TaxID=1969 RepID=UPI0037DC202C|nr:hypothetical protein OIA45_48905 [Streptomyces chartreusis]
MAQAATATQPAMCLKHGDFHIMDGDCWSVTLDWYFTHQTMNEQADRDAYLTAVERKMLDNLLPLLMTAAGRH